MPDLNQITQPRQLLVEGRDALVFFRALLRRLDLTDIQVQNFGAISELRGFVKQISLAPHFADLVTSLGIVRDAEADPSAAFASVQGALRAAGLTVPGSPEIVASQAPQVSVLILPDARSPGSLETLCYRSLAHEPVTACINDFLRCAAQRQPVPPRTAAMADKARLHAYLATRPEPGLLLGEAAQRGLFPWSNPAFERVTRFVRSL